jgi:nucleotide-binding universal stress UspA family protein
MNEWRKVLVPVDFSEDSRLALTCAAELAGRYGARVDVLHVVAQPAVVGDLVSPAFGGARLVDFLCDEAQKQLRVFVADVPGLAEVAGDVLVLPGDPSDRILRRVREAPPDLIVMGTRGRTGLAHVLVGSVAERVIRHAHRPVLVVPGPDPKAHTGG